MTPIREFMAEASVQTANTKQLGKQLRSVRRRKGLSLSEVARGAGLSRRELVSYERGKVEIPQSDLWVLAGSCGVDVAELMPADDVPQLAAGSSSMEDTISQLRSRPDSTGLGHHLDTIYALRALPPGSKVQLEARDRDAITAALGTDPKTLEAGLMDTLHVTRVEAARLRELILPETPRYSPLALEAAPEPERNAEPSPISDPRDLVPGIGMSAFEAETPTGPVDVFEELARLPEPAALPTDAFTGDLLSPPPEPVALPVNAEMAEAGTFAEWQSFRSALPSPSEPVLVESPAAASASATAGFSAADAPPIDIAARTASDWGTGWSTTTTESANGIDSHAETAPDELATRVPSAWAPEPQSWESTQAPGTDTADATDTTDPFGFGPGDGTAWGAPAAVEIVEYVDEYVEAAGPSTDATSEWTLSPAADDTTLAAPSLDTPWSATRTRPTRSTRQEPRELRTGAARGTTSPTLRRPTPASTSTGAPQTSPQKSPPDEPTADADPNTWTPTDPTADLWATTEPTVDADPNTWTPTDPTADLWAITEPTADAWAPTEPSADLWAPTEPATTEPAVDESPIDEPAVAENVIDDSYAPINWRPLGESASPEEIAVVTASILETIAAAEPVAALEDIAPTVDDPPTVEETFITAGSEWELGNAVPLVEVRGQGGLVMRRADERWALADITTATNFALEVDVDFRTGPGFGVLFHASTDADAHMSGFSFDVDPIHEGGSYLVRQWQADRELWNPIARAAADDPAGMHGSLALRLVVIDGCLRASVNGVEVLTVDSLDEACAERHREPAQGNRVGIQAWSSSDLVIDSLRVAER